VKNPVYDATLRVLQRRTSRRRFLARTALAGSALAVAPLRFLLRPVSAHDVVTCADCSSGDLCCDGWTEFCCKVGSSNSCPDYTYMGGWWKCTDYQGGGLCSAEGVRYYIDCNRSPTSSCPSGCHCTNNNCGNRSTCCNVFRYGQCNTEIIGVTEVVCRMVTCEKPSTLFVNCDGTLFIDDLTCSHEAGCLDLAEAVPG
jgi:hypothetical protein